MKKTALITGALVSALLIIFLLKPKAKSIYNSSEEVGLEVQADEVGPIATSQNASEHTSIITQESSNQVDEKEPQLDCHTRYQKHPNWQEISNIYESFYLSMGEMMGEHHYQQMTLDAVKSYADAGDVDAMFHYGSELIWKGGFGIYFNELNRAETLTQEERRERVNKHQLEKVMLEQGRQYLIESAIQGKLGGLIELQLLSHHILKRQMSREANLENTRQALMLSMAYEALLMQVFTKDAEMMKDFTFEGDREEFVQQFLKNYPQQELESIEQEAGRVKAQLFDYWQQERENLGLPVYPDKFPPHLEQHVKDKRSLCGG